MRIAICIASMGVGGAERVVSHMANYWCGQGHEVSIITLAAPGAESAYPLDERVTLLNLDVTGDSSGLWEKLAGNFKRIKELRRCIVSCKPDIVISHVDTMNVLVSFALMGVGVKLIAVEHIYPPSHPIGRAWEALRLGAYAFVDRLAVLTEDTRQWFPEYIRKKTMVIPNPIVSGNGIQAASREKLFPHTLLCVGRLARQKGYDMMLEAFASLEKKHPEWGLLILGEGPERSSLESMVMEYGLESRVRLLGVVDGPFERYHGDVYALSSRYEGFPMALCEAMAAGVAPVAFACPTGPADIVTHGEDGLLVENGNVEELSVALDKLMSDERLRVRLGEKAKSAIARFSLEKVMEEWDDVIMSPVDGKRASK